MKMADERNDGQPVIWSPSNEGTHTMNNPVRTNKYKRPDFRVEYEALQSGICALNIRVMHHGDLTGWATITEEMSDYIVSKVVAAVNERLALAALTEFLPSEHGHPGGFVNRMGPSWPSK